MSTIHGEEEEQGCEHRAGEEEEQGYEHREGRRRSRMLDARGIGRALSRIPNL